MNLSIVYLLHNASQILCPLITLVQKTTYASYNSGNPFTGDVHSSSERCCPAIRLFSSTGSISPQLRLCWDAPLSIGNALLSPQVPSICHLYQGQELGCCEHTPSAQRADNGTDDTCALSVSSSFHSPSGLIRQFAPGFYKGVIVN